MYKLLTPLVFILLMNFLMGCDSKSDDFVEPIPTVDDHVLVLNDIVKGEPVVIFSHSSLNVFTAYSRRLEDGTVLEFKNNKVNGIVQLEDTEGSIWNYTGKALSGNRTGTYLKPIGTIRGLWLAISSFYQKVSLYNKNKEERVEYENPIADWLIDPDLIQQSTGKDDIPSLTNPAVTELTIKNYQTGSLTEDDEVIIVEHNNVVKIYPIKIINWHEVINDVIGGLPITITHSPLSATTTVFKYDGPSDDLLFGVSGKVHNNNLILYDKKTNSLWSQIKNYSINGPLIGQELVSLPFLETNFKYVEEFLIGMPNLFLMNFNTGYDMDYDIFPYGAYRTNNVINFPLTFSDDRVPPKELVLAIIVDNEAKVYRTTDFN